MDLLGRLAELREAIQSAAAASGAMDIRVFGSVARREYDETSDIDFLVSLMPGRSLVDLARLELQLEKLLGRRVDVMTVNGLREPIRSAALREALPV
jgi:predicted nucleotidyltransferase